MAQKTGGFVLLLLQYYWGGGGEVEKPYHVAFHLKVVGPSNSQDRNNYLFASVSTVCKSQRPSKISNFSGVRRLRWARTYFSVSSK